MKEKKMELMTWQEYLSIVNEDNIMHEESAYGHTLSQINNNVHKGYNKIEKRFISHGIEFEIRSKEIDKWNDNYVKHDINGEVLRDENNNIVLLNEEEKAKKIPERFTYEHAIINRQQNIKVAITTDEWNCLLIVVAKEYQGLNLGEKLLEHHRNQYNFRYSGGHTPQGKEALYRVYQNNVSKFLSNGNYSKELSKGNITIKRIKEITKSANITQNKNEKTEYNLESYITRKRRQKQKSENNDYNMFKAEDLLLHIDNNYAILYNRKAFNNIGSVNDNDYFTNQGLLGYAYIGGVYDSKDTPKLFRLFGQNEKIKEYMTEVILNQYIGEPVKIFDHDLKYLSDNLKSNLIEGFKRDEMTTFTLNDNTISKETFNIMGILEKKFRKENDSFDEKWYLVQEQISSFAEDLVLKREEELEYEKIKAERKAMAKHKLKT